MKVKNIDEELSKVEIDSKTGIKVTLMSGDSNISVFAAEIAPKTKLNPHYHKIGIETYQVLEGCGMMKVGDYKDNRIHWTDSFEVKKGDCFTISSSLVHQIINNSDKILKTIFTCPSDHLGQDRYFVEDV
ncbi:cupin domain-containing protein [Natronoflexus pectinivorans]|uniref:Mannose-6-phosphate isomerase-like protein (Cupin superfamily) n=1 Tax=Natronoflexus pectinivorans TaxID=682526 RepID=A0A4R2G4J1_9BACT|nr:cupin domain-containing protein [Natronoflexus pectinivorans]TCO02440.1 mannose-6-phosphate isomerase-like protein (cupin superfamily) [Natronoflexus pectinivorans]